MNAISLAWRRSTLVSLLLFPVGVLSADQISHDEYARKLFVLRTQFGDSAFRSQGQGIYSHDPDSGSLSRFSSFLYRPSSAPLGRGRLAALSDRVLVQGTDYFEFDLLSGRLLRRYRALDSQFNTWMFQGAVVNDEMSKRLGISSGTYGFPVCPSVFGDPGYGCTGPVNFPGYDQPTANVTRWDVLLRRPLGPDETALYAVGKVSATGPGEHLERTFIAADAPNDRFLLWNAVSTSTNLFTIIQRLSSLPLESGAIQSEQLLHEFSFDGTTPSDQRPIVREFTYHPLRSSIFAVVENNSALDRHFVEWSQDLILQREISSRTPANYSTSPDYDSATSIPSDLPEVYLQVIPLVRHEQSASGFWRSDVWLYNPSEHTQSVTLRRVTRPDRSVTYSLGPHGSREVRDVVGGLGGGVPSEGGDGITQDALVITSTYEWGAQLAARSRLFTEQSGGSYGASVPAVPSAVGYSTHGFFFDYAPDTEAGQSMFILDKRKPDDFRHTIGVVNDSALPLELRLRYGDTLSNLYTPNRPSNPDVEKHIVIAPHSVTSTNVESLFPASFATERPPRIWISADRPAPIWLSMTDTRTNDVTLVPYSLISLRGDSETEVTIPAIANTDGMGGTTWRTDIYGFFLTLENGEENQQPLIHFDAADEICSSKAMRLTGTTGWGDSQEASDPYWKSIFPSVGQQVGCGGIGALRLRDASWMAGFSRTYTARSDGGTYGDILPFYPGDGWPTQHFSGIYCNGTSRVNIGLYNGKDYAITNRLLLYDSSGALAAQEDVDVPSRGSKRIPLPALLPACSSSGPFGLSVVPLDKAGQPGRSWAYVSSVDNVTGDPTNLW